MDHFYHLKIRNLLAHIVRGSTSFKLILFYIVIEYLRPQSMYPALQAIPWGMLALGGAFVSVFLEKKPPRRRNHSTFFLNLFFLVIIISSLFAISPGTSFGGMKTFLIYYLVYYLVTNILDSEEKIFIFTSFILLFSYKLAQAVFISWCLRGFAYDRYGAAVGSGWLENSGELAPQLCIAFSFSICFLKSLWYHNKAPVKLILGTMPIIFVGGIIACGSRGSYLALASVFIAMVLFGKKKIIGILILSVVILLVPHLASDRDKERSLSAGGEGDSTASNRLERWKKGLEMTHLYPVFGVGYENWAIADKRLFNGEGSECHNIFIECMSELGYVGLTAFFLLIFSTLKNNLETMKLSNQNESQFLYNLAFSLNLSLLAYLVAGFFVTVLYYPYFWINLPMTASLNNIAKSKYLKEQNAISLQ